MLNCKGTFNISGVTFAAIGDTYTVLSILSGSRYWARENRSNLIVLHDSCINPTIVTKVSY